MDWIRSSLFKQYLCSNTLLILWISPIIKARFGFGQTVCLEVTRRFKSSDIYNWSYKCTALQGLPRVSTMEGMWRVCLTKLTFSIFWVKSLVKSSLLLNLISWKDTKNSAKKHFLYFWHATVTSKNLIRQMKKLKNVIHRQHMVNPIKVIFIVIFLIIDLLPYRLIQ